MVMVMMMVMVMVCGDGVQRLGYSGWMGFGGSVLQWHEKQDIAFGYAMNLMEREQNNSRGLALQRIVLKCVKAQDDY